MRCNVPMAMLLALLVLSPDSGAALTLMSAAAAPGQDLTVFGYGPECQGSHKISVRYTTPQTSNCWPVVSADGSETGNYVSKFACEGTSVALNTYTDADCTVFGYKVEMSTLEYTNLRQGVCASVSGLYQASSFQIDNTGCDNNFCGAKDYFPVCRSSVTGVGDPHMTNLRGDRFDVRKEGYHNLLKIPRDASPESTLLSVVGLVHHHKNCQTQYIRELNITGKWVEEKYHANRFFNAAEPRKTSKAHKVINFDIGPMTLVVTYTYSKKGFCHFDFEALHLNEVKLPVGGILGMDEYGYAVKPDCRPPVLKLYATDAHPVDVTESTDEIDQAEGSFASARLA